MRDGSPGFKNLTFGPPVTPLTTEEVRILLSPCSDGQLFLTPGRTFGCSGDHFIQMASEQPAGAPVITYQCQQGVWTSCAPGTPDVCWFSFVSALLIGFGLGLLLKHWFDGSGPRS